MADVIREHIAEREDGSGMGYLAGIILLVIVLSLLFYYGLLPYIKNATSVPQINVPDKIDININNP